jgi:hypothetical protein
VRRGSMRSSTMRGTLFVMSLASLRFELDDGGLGKALGEDAEAIVDDVGVSEDPLEEVIPFRG